MIPVSEEIVDRAEQDKSNAHKEMGGFVSHIMEIAEPYISWRYEDYKNAYKVTKPYAVSFYNPVLLRHLV